MKYIVCVTNFHLLVAKAIYKDWSHCSYKVLDLRRFSHTDNWWGWFKSQCVGVVGLMQCLFDRESHAVVSHPYNLWFSIFIRAAKKTSFYDDGVAYYNNSKTPARMMAYIYSMLASKISRLLSERAEVYGYTDVLKDSNIENYYCIYPELFSGEEAFFVDKIIGIDLISSEDVSVLALDGVSANDGVAIFLDSVPEVLACYDAMSIYKYFEGKYKGSSVRFYYKPHPSRSTSLSALFFKCDWALEVSGSFEEFISRENVSDIYSFYSSASMIARMYSEKTNIFCFYTADAESIFSGVIPLMNMIGAEVLRVEG